MSYELLAFAFLFILCVFIYYIYKKFEQPDFSPLENYQFHPGIAVKVKEAYPHLNDQQVSLVLQALKDYFYICIKANKKMVSMPSKVVDTAWHEFILFTRDYESFSKNILGYFLHHTPAEAMEKPTQAQTGIKRAWRIACEKEGINSVKPNQLPLIFAIDAELNIEGGYIYTLNCQSKSGDVFCATHIGCASGCTGSPGSNEGGFFSDFLGSGESGAGGGGCGGS